MGPIEDSKLSGLLSSDYTLPDVLNLRNFLTIRGVFDFVQFRTGAFPAVGDGSLNPATSGYRAAWVRDNVHIAYAHVVGGQLERGLAAVRCLARFYKENRRQLTAVIDGAADPSEPMNRPHIRFNAETGAPIEARWPHAQNDALGYFLWLFATLAVDRTLALCEDDASLLADFPRYFEAIQYWQDEDSGHWEEQRKVSASSIGTVVAGLTAYRQLLAMPRFGRSRNKDLDAVDALITRGRDALDRILPHECRQAGKEKRRRYDAALLFLIDPLDVVDAATGDRILRDIAGALQGPEGISRYPGDSYWGPDYRRIPPSKRTIDLSEDLIQRSDFAVRGREARWCIFDAIISVIWGRRYLDRQEVRCRKEQVRYLNRALRQVVPLPHDPSRLAVPEAYFFEAGAFVPNDHIPLQWAQANLWRAVAAMERSVRA